MYIRASSAHGLDNSQFRHYWNSHITGILIQQNLSTQLQALYSLTLDLQIWRVKNSWIWSQSSYVIIAYIINFQVLSTPGQVRIKFHLYIFGIHLRINWVVELRKVSQTTASLQQLEWACVETFQLEGGCWNTSGILVCKCGMSPLFYLLSFYYFHSIPKLYGSMWSQTSPSVV